MSMGRGTQNFPRHPEVLGAKRRASKDDGRGVRPDILRGSLRAHLRMTEKGFVAKNLQATKMLRKEDASLLSGRGRYADDLPVPVGTLHAHVIRSPHAHADIVRIDARAALAHDGVWAVITGEDVRKLSDPFLGAVKTPVQQWSLAVERVRYVGEPVALVVAESRYIAEDAAELVEIDYAALAAVIDPIAACESGAAAARRGQDQRSLGARISLWRHQGGVRPRRPPHRHDDGVSAAVVHADRVLRRRRPAQCRREQLRRAGEFPGTVLDASGDGALAARAGPKLRLRIPPDSGGSFGIKLSVFPYVVLMALAAHITGRPVKWVEDRIEHLVAASSGPNRVTKIEAAVANDGRILALRLDQLEDYGAFLRAPMPGPLYRMHGAVTGAYDIANVDVKNRVVLTNKMPASLIRGFGGPQLYLALERLMQRIAVELKLDPLDVIRRNLIPAQKFPYRTAAGALYDSGDYRARRRDRGRGGQARRAQAPPRRGARRRPHLRHRLCRHRRAGDVEHGLSLDA